MRSMMTLALMLFALLLCGCNAAKTVASCNGNFNLTGTYTTPTGSVTATFPPTIAITMTGTSINLSSQWDYAGTPMVLNGTLQVGNTPSNSLPEYGPNAVTSGPQGNATDLVQWKVSSDNAQNCEISSFTAVASDSQTVALYTQQ